VRAPVPRVYRATKPALHGEAFLGSAHGQLQTQHADKEEEDDVDPAPKRDKRYQSRLSTMRQSGDAFTSKPAKVSIMRVAAVQNMPAS
jgi:hypothetical protein